MLYRVRKLNLPPPSSNSFLVFINQLNNVLILTTIITLTGIIGEDFGTLCLFLPVFPVL